MDDKLLERIAKLAHLVAEASDLSEIETYFHDSIVPDPAFMAAGSSAVHKPLQAVVRSVARLYSCELTDECRFLHVPQFSLWHGSLGNPLGSMALLIYFDDQHRGIASFGRLSDSHTHRFRFSLPEGARDPEVDTENLKLTSVSNRRGLA
jgi:hypothetical protein